MFQSPYNEEVAMSQITYKDAYTPFQSPYNEEVAIMGIRLNAMKIQMFQSPYNEEVAIC